MKARLASLCVVLLCAAALAAEDAAPAPAPAVEPVPAVVPDEVLNAAAEAAKPKPAQPSAEALALADRIDVLLLTCETLLAKGEVATAGERFVGAVGLMEEVPQADKRALGARYTGQRRQLTALAQRLLADPGVAAALGDQPLVPTPAEEKAATEKPGL